LLDETLHYSRTGAEAMPRHIAKAVTAAGGQIIQNAEVTQLIHNPDTGRVTHVQYHHEGADHTLACDECISTIPIPHLLLRASPPPPDPVLTAASEIRYKPIAIYGLLVKKTKCIDGLYIYSRDRAFHRVGEPKNAGLIVNPPDHTVLIVETTCEIGDPKWNATPDAKDQIFADLELENICHRDDIVETHILHSETGYPLFSLGFETHLAVWTLKTKRHFFSSNLTRCTTNSRKLALRFKRLAQDLAVLVDLNRALQTRALHRHPRPNG
jgi:protoporphyrinogen oxidase